VWRGTSSSISPGESCPSDCANGPIGSDQWDSVLAVQAGGELGRSSRSLLAAVKCSAWNKLPNTALVAGGLAFAGHTAFSGHPAIAWCPFAWCPSAWCPLAGCPLAGCPFAWRPFAGRPIFARQISNKERRPPRAQSLKETPIFAKIRNVLHDCQETCQHLLKGVLWLAARQNRRCSAPNSS
jgi:hypothetical protein